MKHHSSMNHMDRNLYYVHTHKGTHFCHCKRTQVAFFLIQNICLQQAITILVSIQANPLIKRKIEGEKQLPKPPQLVMGLRNTWASSTDNTATGMFSPEHLQSHMKQYFRDMAALIEVKAEYL